MTEKQLNNDWAAVAPQKPRQAPDDGRFRVTGRRGVAWMAAHSRILRLSTKGLHYRAKPDGSFLEARRDARMNDRRSFDAFCNPKRNPHPRAGRVQKLRSKNAAGTSDVES